MVGAGTEVHLCHEYEVDKERMTRKLEGCGGRNETEDM